jgi:phosphoribosylanthranilate isomerase
MAQVKICGITNKEDALYASQCGAVALGFIFYPPSSRYIKPDDAKKIISALPDKLVRVGVFVNEKPEEIKRVMESCALDMIQLHGDEKPGYCHQFPAFPMIKAVSLNSNNDVEYACSFDVAAILVDSRHDGLYGGTGKKSNWELARSVGSKKRLILSGGLDAENIADAIIKVVPAGLDINSGVETSPGIKDHAKIERLFATIRKADTASKNLPFIFQKRTI